LNTIETDGKTLRRCTKRWFDVGTGAKGRWIYVVFYKKIRKIEEKVFPSTDRSVSCTTGTGI
jgi:hypothetical protein